MDVRPVPRLLIGRGMPWQRGTHDPDAERVAAAQADPACFVALYDLYVDRIHRYVRLHMHSQALSEDVTSQVFVTALARIGRFQVREGGSFAAWLFRIAHNAVQDVYREREVQHDAEALLAAVHDPTPGPEEQALSGERIVRLRRAIAHLRPVQQHLLALRYGADLGIDEIAQTLGKNAGAVRVSLHRTLRELRRRYPHDE